MRFSIRFSEREKTGKVLDQVLEEGGKDEKVLVQVLD